MVWPVFSSTSEYSDRAVKLGITRSSKYRICGSVDSCLIGDVCILYLVGKSEMLRSDDHWNTESRGAPHRTAEVVAHQKII